jgi:hypothetical protein
LDLGVKVMLQAVWKKAAVPGMCSVLLIRTDPGNDLTGNAFVLFWGQPDYKGS